jgi:C4-dicarboxylate transporter DctM subunit
VTTVIRAALPWLAVLLAALLVVTYVPSVSLVLPSALG